MKKSLFKSIKKSQVPTPTKYVNLLLKAVGYNNATNIIGKTFLENSCGKGSIAIAAIKKYIYEARKIGECDEQLKNELESLFVFYEIDGEVAKFCKRNLESLTTSLG